MDEVCKGEDSQIKQSCKTISSVAYPGPFHTSMEQVFSQFFTYNVCYL